MGVPDVGALASFNVLEMNYRHIYLLISLFLRNRFDSA